MKKKKNRDTLFSAPVMTSPSLAVVPRRVVASGRYVREPFDANYDIAPDGKSFVLVFFFSSRRRHTRSLRDWSSDVCSSDLALEVSDDHVSHVVPLEYLDR